MRNRRDRHGAGALARRRRGEKGQAEQQRARGDKIDDRAAREAEQQAEQQHRKFHRGDERPRLAQDQVLAQPDDWRHEKRPVDVGVLERAHRPAVVVEGEIVASSRDIEIAKNSQHRGDQAGDDIAAADCRHPLAGRRGDDAGEKERGQRDVDRDRDEGDALQFVDEGDERQQATGVVDRQRHDQRRHRSVEAQAAGREGEQRDEEHRLIGRRLDRREGADGEK